MSRSTLLLAIASLAASAACAAPTLERRAAAAHASAQTNETCQAVAPFYWSIGDARGVVADGRVGARAPAATRGEVR